MIRITANKGFQLTFENKLTISVQVGSMNYCSRKNINAGYGDEMKADFIESPDAEIAIWDDKGNWLDFGSDQVKGYVPVDEISQWITFTKVARDLEDLADLANLPKTQQA
jgi:hypothetical protein